MDYSPQKLRERTLETLLEWLLAATHDGPTLCVVEDLHWADPTTLEFVSSLLESMSAEPLLTILTFRPDLEPPWQQTAACQRCRSRVSHPKRRARWRYASLHGKTIPDDVLSQIVARTEGVPLFVEEVTKAVLELGVLVEQEDRFELSGPLPPDLIPATVQGSLNARLRSTGPCEGNRTTRRDDRARVRLRAVSTVAEDDQTNLRQGLDRLIDAELALPARGLAGRDVSLQACAHPRRRVSIASEEVAARAARAHRRGARQPLPRDGHTAT